MKKQTAVKSVKETTLDPETHETAKAQFDKDGIVRSLEYWDKKGWEAVGYKRGRLMYWNGKTTKPISLSDSVRAVARMGSRFVSVPVEVCGNLDSDFEGEMRWYRTVAKALSVLA